MSVIERGEAGFVSQSAKGKEQCLKLIGYSKSGSRGKYMYVIGFCNKQYFRELWNMLLFWQTYFLDSEMCGHQENMTNVTVRNVLLIKLPYDSLQVYNTTKNKTNMVCCISLQSSVGRAKMTLFVWNCLPVVILFS